MMWHAFKLDGLSPKHFKLEIVRSYTEDCYIEPLNTLKHQWNNLESLTVHGICEHEFMTSAPNFFSQISSLSLVHWTIAVALQIS